MARAVGQVPTQADKRRNMTLTDDHGRKYFAVIEKATGVPTGLVQPLFTVPHPSLVPPMKYMEYPEDRPGYVHLNYVAWEADARASLEEWERNKVEIVAQLPGGAANPILHRILGPRPIDPRLIVAMRQGNRWVLGLTDKKPPEAELILPTIEKTPDIPVFSETEPVFTEEVVEGQAAGMDLPALLEEINKRCPPHLKGTARNNWAMGELARMANAPTGG